MEEIGKYIWVKNSHDQYDTIPDITDDTFQVEVETDLKKETISVEKSRDYPEVCVSCLRGVNNLQLLEDHSLNSITHNLRIRFFENKFYTFIDKNILLSLNSFDSSDYIDKEYLQIYRNFFNKNNPNPEPHLFYIAESAYQNILKYNCSQSIIITGESGAGKTQITKTILKYFSFMNVKSLNLESVDNAMQLLESFGNAKTIHNKNSSRFLKFIKIYFSDDGSEVISYEFNNFLLETSRLIKLQADELNFNIFYQILGQLEENEKKKYLINDRNIESFFYLCHNENTHSIDESENNISITKNLLNFFNFTDKDIESIFSLIISILFIGNIEYEEVFINGSTYGEIDVEEENLSNAALLLDIDKQDLKRFLTRNINDKNLSIEPAMILRDNLSKTIYLHVFNWITKKINSYFAENMESLKNKKFIGVLDMFGYEFYDISNYDQFCANYANEKIQKFFNDSVFKEQELYKNEKIHYDKIEYLDNNAVIDLIEKDSTGILSVLNSETNLTNTEFKTRINISENNLCLGDSVDGFILIHHSTGEVIYDVNNLLENSNSKNFSSICEEFPPLAKRMNNILGNINTSLDIKFMMNELVKTLSYQKPFFIKCIKPNLNQNSKTFHFFRVSEQILSNGIIETLKLKTSAYSSIYSFEKFYKKYIQLVPDLSILKYLGIQLSLSLSSEKKVSYDDIARDLLDAISDFPEINKLIKQFMSSSNISPIQLGENKIFMKKEIKIALKEKLKYILKVVLIQKLIKGYILKKKFLKLKSSAIIIQNSYKHYKFKQFISIKIKSLIKMSRDGDFDEDQRDHSLDYSKMIIKNDYNNSLNLNLSIDEDINISSHSDGNSLSFETDGVSNVKNNNQLEGSRETSNKYVAQEFANPVSVIDTLHNTPTKQKSAGNVSTNNLGNSKNSKNSESIIAASKSRISEKIRSSKLLISEIEKNSCVKLDHLVNLNILTTEDESQIQARNILSKFEENFDSKTLTNNQIQKNNSSNVSPNQYQDQISNFNQNENLNNSLIESINNIFNTKEKKSSQLMKPKLNSSLKDLTLNSIIGSEYISTIEKLKKEIISLQTENEDSKNQLANLKLSKEKEIELLNEKLKHLKNVVLNCEQEIKELNEKNLNSSQYSRCENNPLIEKEIEKLKEENINLKKSLLDSESQLDILKMNQTNLKKSNDEMNKIIETHKEQSFKRKEKEENEVSSLFDIIHKLEKEKIELESKFMTLDSKFQYNSYLSLNSKFDNLDFAYNTNEKTPNEMVSYYKKMISNLKNTNKNLNTEIEKIRFDTQIDIIKLSTENREKTENFEKISKEFSKLEFQVNSSRKENLDLVNTNKQLKDLAEKLQNRINILEKNSKKSKNISRLEESLKAKEIQLRDLKSKNEYDIQNLERMKKMEIALKEELVLKENEIEKRREIIKAIQDQLENSNDENLKLKKENIQIKSKLELREIEIGKKYENMLKLKSEEISQLKQKLVIYEKYLPEFKTQIEKKRIRIKKYKKMNAILIELLKIKKNQMQCTEALQYTDSLNIKDNLKKFENDEKKLMKEVQDISALLDESEDEDEDDEEIYEEEFEIQGVKIHK